MSDDGMRERIARAALDAACYWDDGEQTSIASPVTWETADDYWRSCGYRIADAVLAALERDAA